MNYFFSLIFSFLLCANCNSQVIGEAWNMHIIDSTLFGADGVKITKQNGYSVFSVGWEQSGITRAYIYDSSMQYLHYVEVPAMGVEDAFTTDFNNDGLLDIVCFLEEPVHRIEVHYANSYFITNKNATFTKKNVTSSPEQWMYGVVTDVNNDGYQDIIGGSKKTGATVTLFLNPGNKTDDWTAQKLANAGWVMSLKLIDMDNDGDDDVLISDRDFATSGVKWLENPGTKNYTNTWTEHKIGLTDRHPMFLNAYKKNKSITIISTEITQGIYQFREKKSYKEEKLFAIPDNCGEWTKDVAFFDIDNDGKNEIITSFNNSYNKHGIIYSKKQKKEYKHYAISGIQSPKYDNLLFVDMDLDGDFDILTTEENDNSNTKAGLGFIWYENKIK